MTESLTTSQVIPLVAVETEPSDTIVQVSEVTLIELSNKAVKSPEEYKEWVFKLAIEDANQILKAHDLAIIKNEITG